jgi:hypothetical protein
MSYRPSRHLAPVALPFDARTPTAAPYANLSRQWLVDKESPRMTFHIETADTLARHRLAFS